MDARSSHAVVLALVLTSCGGIAPTSSDSETTSTETTGVAQRPSGTPVPQADAPAAWADTICEHETACGCGEPCEVSPIEFGDAFAMAEENGLTYDAQCMGQLLADLDWQACVGPGDDQAATCEHACTPWVGTVPEGGGCGTFSTIWMNGPVRRQVATICQQGLYCKSELCVPFCVGQNMSEWDGCGGLCAAGEVCTFFPEATCVPIPQLGEACVAGQCSVETHCVDTVCVEDLPDGDRCGSHDECQSGHCPNGYCWVAPELGEPCLVTCAGDDVVCGDGVCRVGVAVCGD